MEKNKARGFALAPSKRKPVQLKKKKYTTESESMRQKKQTKRIWLAFLGSGGGPRRQGRSSRINAEEARKKRGGRALKKRKERSTGPAKRGAVTVLVGSSRGKKDPVPESGSAGMCCD